MQRQNDHTTMKLFTKLPIAMIKFIHGNAHGCRVAKKSAKEAKSLLIQSRHQSSPRLLLHRFCRNNTKIEKSQFMQMPLRTKEGLASLLSILACLLKYKKSQQLSPSILRIAVSLVDKTNSPAPKPKKQGSPKMKSQQKQRSRE